MISDLQRAVINFTTKHINKKNYSINMYNYFAIFEKTPGYFLIKAFLNKIYYINLTFSIIKHFIGIFNTKVDFLSNIKKNHRHNKLIISWAFLKNFDKNGVFTDKFLKKKSNQIPKNLWLLIYMDKKLPKKINDNIILVYKNLSKTKKFMYFFSYILTLFKKNFLSLSFFKKLNSFSSTSFQIKKFLENKVNFKSITRLLIVYEGQPFQKDILSFFKQKSKNIKIQGYDHSAPPPLPLNLIYDKFSPDEILITGNAQKKFYTKHLSWPKKKIKIISSLRFKDEKKNFYMKKIFLPFEIRSPNVYLKNIHHIRRLENLNLLHVRNHPLQSQSSKHIKLIKSINSITKVKSRTDTKKKKFSIFLGQTTAVIIALDLGITCYHICPEPIFDSYSSALWETIKVDKLNDNLFRYSSKTINNFF